MRNEVRKKKWSCNSKNSKYSKKNSQKKRHKKKKSVENLLFSRPVLVRKIFKCFGSYSLRVFRFEMLASLENSHTRAGDISNKLTALGRPFHIGLLRGLLLVRAVINLNNIHSVFLQNLKSLHYFLM